jgi:hypothetical protein
MGGEEYPRRAAGQELFESSCRLTKRSFFRGLAPIRPGDWSAARGLRHGYPVRMPAWSSPGTITSLNASSHAGSMIADER